MNVVGFLLFTFVLFSVGFIVGGIYQAVKQIDYKRRWLEAIELLKRPDVAELLQGDLPVFEPFETEHVEIGGKKFSRRMPDASENAREPDYKRITWWARRDIEEKRLQNGLTPRDPLDGLPAHAVSAIEEARIDAGWDIENGRWVKVK